MIRIIILLILYTFNIIISYTQLKSKKAELTPFKAISKNINVSYINKNATLKTVNSQTKNRQPYLSIDYKLTKELIKPLVTFVKN